MAEGMCSNCWKKRSQPYHAYCRECRNAYQRQHRARHGQLSVDQRHRANARSYANVYKRRGKIKQQPCGRCGSEDSQMHHRNYNAPLLVEWLCVRCHRDEHSFVTQEQSQGRYWE